VAATSGSGVYGDPGEPPFFHSLSTLSTIRRVQVPTTFFASPK